MIRFKKKGGYSIIIVVLFMTLLTLIGYSMASVTIVDNLSVANEVKGQVAYYAAVSACDRATRDLVTKTVTADKVYSTSPAYMIGNATIELLKIETVSPSPPYTSFFGIPVGADPTDCWKITARARVGGTYRQVIMFRIKASNAATGTWPAYRALQAIYFSEDRNYR